MCWQRKNKWYYKINLRIRKSTKGVKKVVNTREIKAQMQRKGMTQVMLAQKLGINPSTLNRKINNEKGDNLTVKEAVEMAEALDFPRNEITDIFFAS